MIDTQMFGEPEMMAAHLLPGARPAIVDPGPANTAENVIDALGDLGIDQLDSIILTHIHFDHAGAAARLAREYPGATVYIHSRVTRHLADPSQLTESVKSVWGDQTESLFGFPESIDPDRIQSLEDGDTIDLGDRLLEAIATPGHTRAHMSFYDQKTTAILCGDALGLRLPGSPIIRPASPPADYSREEAIASIERIRAKKPSSLHLAHFGLARQDPEATCDRAIRAINDWHESFLKKRETSEGEEDLLRRVNACVEAKLEPNVKASVRRGFEAVNPTWLNVAGMTGEIERAHAKFSDAA
ncbi:MAG: MBL fold metallo-hydrolase [Thermoleophilia bacterium]|nr:MBL fold metallo-hydrolase [Thermoleophilia bacterium]